MIFGLTSLPSIMIGFVQGVVAVIVTTLDGLDRVPRVLRKLARTQHMTALETAWLITLPAAAPWLLSGAKLADRVLDHRRGGLGIPDGARGHGISRSATPTTISTMPACTH